MKVKEIKPVLSDIITTADKITQTPSGVLLPDSKTVKPVQIVLAIGPHANNLGINVGDTIEINPDSFKKTYTEPKHGVGPDTEAPIIPIFGAEDGDFMKIRIENILWVLDKAKTKKAKK